MDARHVETTYDYDGLNRLVRRAYSVTNGYPAPSGYVATPAVNYFYDGTGMPTENSVPLPTPGRSGGRLTAVKSSVSETIYTEFDAAGRVKKHRQISDPGTTAAQHYLMEYGYDLAGNLTSQKYPSGKVVRTEHDSAGRIAGVKDQSTSGFYAGAAHTDTVNRLRYAAHGAIESLKLGNGLWEQTLFNQRLQPTRIDLGTPGGGSSVLRLDYGYGPANQNNGNLHSQTIIAPGLTLAQTYTYDHVNRLTLARETRVSDGQEMWKQGYTYLDQNSQNGRFGNRRVDAANTTANVLPAYNPQINPADNRYSAGQGYAYDTAGNLTSDQLYTFRYDGENRLAASDLGGDPNSATAYGYDGDGRRVKKSSAGGLTTIFVYDAPGRLVAEYSNQPSDNGTSFLTQDHLGSTRVVTGRSQEVKGRYDYLPFGEEVSAGRTGYGGGSVRQKFTGKERDSDTGLDYFGARYYASAHGRFTSTDPIAIKKRHLSNPQDLNRYSYVANNPHRYIDPTGEEKVEVTVRTFIPYEKVTYPPGVGQTFNGNVNSKGERLPGEEGYKTEQRITIETDPKRADANQIQTSNGVGITRLYRAWPLKTREARADGKSLHIGATRTDAGVVVDAKGDESNPLAPASPGITFNLKILVQSEGADGKLKVTVTGTHDGYPAYEVEIKRPESGGTVTTLVLHDPRDTGEDPGSLFPPEEHQANKQVEIPPKKR